MSIVQISQEEFNDLSQLYRPIYIASERAWFKSDISNVLGTLILDPFDKNWSYIVLEKNTNGEYEAIDIQIDFESPDEAVNELLDKMVDTEYPF